MGYYKQQILQLSNGSNSGSSSDGSSVVLKDEYMLKLFFVEMLQGK